MVKGKIPIQKMYRDLYFLKSISTLHLFVVKNAVENSVEKVEF